MRAPTRRLQAMNIAIKPENINAREALAGKVSLVTGSTSGIGLGIARALAAAGSEIVLNGFGKSEEVADVQAKIASDFKVRVSYSPADMSKPAAIREMIENTLKSPGRLDILINNAGIQHVAPLQDFPPEKWDAILAVDLSSAFHTTRLALPAMLSNKWGRIINIASAHGLVGSPFKSAYVAAKHGIIGLTLRFRSTAAGSRINASALQLVIGLLMVRDLGDSLSPLGERESPRESRHHHQQWPARMPHVLSKTRMKRGAPCWTS